MTETIHRRIEIEQVTVSDQDDCKTEFMIRVFETRNSCNTTAKKLTYTKEDVIALANELLTWAQS